MAAVAVVARGHWHRLPFRSVSLVGRAGLGRKPYPHQLPPGAANSSYFSGLEFRSDGSDEPFVAVLRDLFGK